MSDPIEERIGELEHEASVYNRETDELRSKVKLIGEYINNLEITGFQRTNHNEKADQARQRMSEIAKQFKEGT